MGGALIERETTLLPLSLVLKEMKLFTATYEGSPAEPLSSSTFRSAKFWRSTEPIVPGLKSTTSGHLRREGAPK